MIRDSILYDPFGHEVIELHQPVGFTEGMPVVQILNARVYLYAYSL